jgi:hypothetical protein
MRVRHMHLPGLLLIHLSQDQLGLEYPYALITLRRGQTNLGEEHAVYACHLVPMELINDKLPYIFPKIRVRV